MAPALYPFLRHYRDEFHYPKIYAGAIFVIQKSYILHFKSKMLKQVLTLKEGALKNYVNIKGLREASILTDQGES